MSISFGSINTGLPKDIVQKIIAAEKIPVNKMEERKAKIEDKKKLLNKLIELVNALRDDTTKLGNERDLREFKVNTNNDMVDVTVDKNVTMPGRYSLEVDQLARKSSAMTNGVEDKSDTYLGVGYLQYETPDGESYEIYIDEENSSLEGIAKLINSDPKGGMTATVVNDGSDSDAPWRLIMALKNTGSMALADFPYIYLVDGHDDLYIDQEREATNAVIKLDGFEIETPENKIKDLIPGVTFDLKKPSKGEEFSVEVVEDRKAITGKLSGLVEKLNKVLSFIKEQNTIDEKTDTQRTLGGDLSLQTLESSIRRTIFQYVNTEDGQARIGDLGVSFKRDGLLEFDEKKFDNAIQVNYRKSAQILTGYVEEGGVRHKGFMDNLKASINSAVGMPAGTLYTRKNGLKSNTDQIDRQIATRMRMLDDKEKGLKDKFARLEGTIARIRGQGAGLQGMGGGGSPVPQLG